ELFAETSNRRLHCPFEPSDFFRREARRVRSLQSENHSGFSILREESIAIDEGIKVQAVRKRTRFIEFASNVPSRDHCAPPLRTDRKWFFAASYLVRFRRLLRMMSSIWGSCAVAHRADSPNMRRTARLEKKPSNISQIPTDIPTMRANSRRSMP